MPKLFANYGFSGNDYQQKLLDKANAFNFIVTSLNFIDKTVGVRQTISCRF